MRGTAGAGLVVRQRFTPVAVRLPDGKRVKTTAAAYDPRLDDVAHITYARGDSAAALADGRHRPWTWTSRRSTTCGSAARSPSSSRPGAGRELKVGALTDQAGCGGFGMQGGLFFGFGTMERFVPGGQDSALYVNASPGTDADAVAQAPGDGRSTPYPQVQVRDHGRLQEAGPRPDRRAALPRVRAARTRDRHRGARGGQHPRPVGRGAHPGDRTAAGDRARPGASCAG